MTRRKLLKVSAGCSFLPRLLHAESSSFYYRDYSKCLPDHLARLAREAYEKRNREIEALTTPAAIRARQQWVTQTLWKLIGGPLERTPLNPHLAGKLERDGYRLEKVVYESRPRLFVSANVYIPTKGEPPYPGVLFQMGHSLQGKAYPSYQKCCQALARLGYLVLAFDPMGQGERIYYPDPTGTKTRTGSADGEHTHPGKQFLLLGTTSTQFQLWDAIRSLDYLAAHPMVDSDRLASTGQSGGATLTMLLAAVDPRLRTAVVSSGNTENFACADFNAPGSTDDAEQNFIGSGVLGFDRWDLLYPLAPKPLLILVSSHDFYGTYSPRYLTNGREEYEKLAKTYDVLGHQNHIDWRDTPLPHGLTYSLRLATYNWFERWLKDSPRTLKQEPPVAPEPMDALLTGPQGNVVRDRNSRRPIDVIRDKAQSLQRDSVSPAWTQSLELYPPARQLQLRKLAQTPSSGVHIEAVEVSSTLDLWIPAWLFVPLEADSERPALLLLDESGRNQNVGEDGLYHSLAQLGATVCAADLSGIGDCRPEVGRGNPGYTVPHDSEENFAWASLILANSLVVQRTQDILSLVQGMKNDTAARGRRIVVAARGRLTVPALFAFAASPLIESLYLSGGLVSYRNLLETEDYEQPLANLCWNVFAQTDLPQLAAVAFPRVIHLAGSVDSTGAPLSEAKVREIYSSRNVRIRTEARWDLASLSAL